MDRAGVGLSIEKIEPALRQRGTLVGQFRHRPGRKRTGALQRGPKALSDGIAAGIADFVQLLEIVLDRVHEPLKLVRRIQRDGSAIARGVFVESRAEDLLRLRVIAHASEKSVHEAVELRHALIDLD